MNEQLKQRVAGVAIVLTIAVVFIPMVLRGPPPGPDEDASAPVVLNPPSSRAESDGFSSRIVPVEPAARAGAPPPDRAAGASVATRRPVGAPPPAAPSTTVSAGRSSPVSAPPAQGWAVQLGAFSEPGNAIALRERLKAEGHEAFVESAIHDGRRVTKVLVGPTPSRERAAMLLERLRSTTSLRGMLVPYPAP